MDRHLDGNLAQLKDSLTRMGGLVESALAVSMTDIQKVYDYESKINSLHKSIGEMCVQILATQQPMAVDLRWIVSSIMINTDLERMGDQAVNIAQSAKRYNEDIPLKPLVDLPIMFQETQQMVREALDSFVRKDFELAKEVLTRDDKVDALKAKIMTDVIAAMKSDPSKIDQGLSLILIARNLERIGDHSTNIAEDVIYSISGKDVRHPKESTENEAVDK